VVDARTAKGIVPLERLVVFTTERPLFCSQRRYFSKRPTQRENAVGKAAVGGAIGSLFNPLGTAVGIATGINGKHGKTKFICQKCGKVFERKV
jgi:hypothetical protein